MTLAALTLTLATPATATPKPDPDPAWQYNWKRWLPAKWVRIARCETGLNWHHSNSQYISAFGISRQAYNEDARAAGALPWNDRKHPTPWQQYRAALGHYKLHYGYSGWGCRNA